MAMCAGWNHRVQGLVFVWATLAACEVDEDTWVERAATRNEVVVDAAPDGEPSMAGSWETPCLEEQCVSSCMIDDSCCEESLVDALADPAVQYALEMIAESCPGITLPVFCCDLANGVRGASWPGPPPGICLNDDYVADPSTLMHELAHIFAVCTLEIGNFCAESLDTLACLEVSAYTCEGWGPPRTGAGCKASLAGKCGHSPADINTACDAAETDPACDCPWAP